MQICVLFSGIRLSSECLGMGIVTAGIFTGDAPYPSNSYRQNSNEVFGCGEVGRQHCVLLDVTVVVLQCMLLFVIFYVLYLSFKSTLRSIRLENVIGALQSFSLFNK